VTGVSIIQFAETSSTITLTENRATILQGVENVGPPGGPGGGGGAPTDASYVTLGTNGTLTDERVLTAGTGITITDGGAGSTVTVGVTASTYQPLDSDLTAIAALSTTTFGRGLLALADAAALRSSAGLVIGTDIYSKAAVDSGFQPLDSDLTAIAALTTTTFGRSLLALADAAATRTALGLAAIAASGSASDLSAGSVPAARFGNTTIPVAAVNASGTPSSTTYLRGDGTWSTPSSGGGLDLAAQIAYGG